MFFGIEFDKIDEEGSTEDRDEPGEKSSYSYYHALKVLGNPTYLVDAYPLLYKVYAIALVIPVSSCTAERTFSVLKRMKTRLRATMEQERLSASLLIPVDKFIVSSRQRTYHCHFGGNLRLNFQSYLYNCDIIIYFSSLCKFEALF